MKMYIESENGKYLLQEYDVYLLLALRVSVPHELADELNEQIDNNYDPNGPRCCYFDLVVENPTSIKWLKRNEYILNYDDFASRTVRDVSDYAETLVRALNVLRERQDDSDYAIIQALTYKIESLDYFLECRNGLLEEKVPYYHDRLS